LKSVEDEINVFQDEKAELIEMINIKAVSNKYNSKYLCYVMCLRVYKESFDSWVI